MKGILLTAIAALAIIGMMFCGCETDSAISPVLITPSAASIQQGESLVFRASGGYDYRWSLDNYTIGHLSASVGPETTYTSIANPSGNTATRQILYVQSTIDDHSTGTGTNMSTYQVSTHVTITHLPMGTGDGATSGQTAGVTISASPSTLSNNGDTSQITASGGVPPYEFNVTVPAAGYLTGSGGATRTYTRTAEGENVVTVVDSAGDSDSVAIQQPV